MHSQVKWVSIAALLAAVLFWNSGANSIRHYAFAAVFGALALLYNPVAPVSSYSRQWQSVFVMASAVPFIASLTWRNAKLVHNE